jgi:hypothetical protein
MARRSRSRRTAGLVGALVGALVLAACSGPAPRHAAPSPAPLRLDASVTQFRTDEGTRNLKAGVTNNSDREIRVSQATIVWDALAFPTVPVPNQPTLPGQTAAFTIAYGAPQCAQEPTTDPVLLAVVDGHPRRLPLRVEDPGLLLRLHAKACAAQRLDRAARVTLRLATRTEVLRGEEYLPGELVLRHRPGATERVSVVDLGGSVLLDLLPRAGRAALPGVLAPDRSVLRYPVVIGSTHRCDPHARSQSSQTFLISAYVRLEDEPTQRLVLPLSTAARDRLNALMDRDCA